MPAALLGVHDLVAGYTGPVVGPVTFQVSAGEVVGLSGANGAGKSTLLAAITGTARVFRGAVTRVDGLRIAHHWQRPERVHEIPLRGRELAVLGGADPSQCPPWLGAHLARPVDELSGGQYQFLHTWVCMAGPADLVLLDEPTNNLDANGMQLLGEMLTRLHPGRAVLLVSHETEFLQRHCTRILEVAT